MERPMKTLLITLSVACLVLGYAPWQASGADVYPLGLPDTPEQAGYAPFTPDELDELLAPIALYPDPLLAQILPAATFVDQIDEAARYVGQFGKGARIDEQAWDVSVKAVAYYPDILFMMDRKYDWTISLGQAFVNQQQDVMDAIQRLRAEAMAAGSLVSTSQQQVIVDDGFISIVPAQPDLIFVPQYDPLAVYIEPLPPDGFITFDVGFTIGVWLDRDCDWRRHRIFYHGWRGKGWIDRSRTHVQVRNSFYINNSLSAVEINRRVMQRTTAQFRENLHRAAEKQRGRLTRPGTPALVELPPVRPAPSGESRQGRPDTRDLYRGRDVQRSQPASSTGYGGYGSPRDATIYRERGQSSRGAVPQTYRPAPAPSAPSSPRQSAPSGHGGGGGRR
jgi:hypothetical protein